MAAKNKRATAKRIGEQEGFGTDNAAEARIWSVPETGHAKAPTLPFSAPPSFTPRQMSDTPLPPDPTPGAPDPAPADPAPAEPPEPRPSATLVDRITTRPKAMKASWARRSVALKIAGIAFIILVLLVPLGLLGGLINERESLRDSARREVAAQWGQEQTLGGPVLTVPYTTVEVDGNGVRRTVTQYAHLFPDELHVSGTMAPEVRQRGIFKVVLYNADLQVRGRFPAFDAAALGINADQLRADEAFLQIGLGDMVGIKDTIGVRWNGAVRNADPGLTTSDVFSTGVQLPVALSDEGATFAFDLDVNGSQEFGVLPVGKETKLTLASTWDTPKFAGAFLPETRAVGADGFSAEWRVLHLNRNYPQAFTGGFGQSTRMNSRVSYDYIEPAAGDASAFGVELLLPVDEYQKTSRAAKYGALFVFLTFLTFFFVETLTARRIHPVQYLLVGFAVTLFYLLLLAFAEHIQFDGAYGLAAVAILALVTLYSRAIFESWRLALIVGGLLSLFYGYFYVLLQLEALALLVGSLGLLVTLAIVMYLSRRVDWYGSPAEAA